MGCPRRRPRSLALPHALELGRRCGKDHRRPGGRHPDRGPWTQGTGATENGIIVDGVLHKIGTELRWEYCWDEPMHLWRVEDLGGRLRIELQPRFDKHSKIEAGIMGTETHQVFGRWSGTLVTDGGESIEFSAMQGFAEESRSRW